MKQIEDEAEEDSDSNDPDTHPDFIDDADSDEEEDSDDKSDNSDEENDSDDESDNSDESDDFIAEETLIVIPSITMSNDSTSSRNELQSKHEVEASISDNQKNHSSHNSRPKRAVRAPARYKSAHAEAGSSEEMLALESARVEKAVQELKTKTKSFQKKLNLGCLQRLPIAGRFALSEHL
ncbi:secreted acidic protein 2-like [Papaver somniferum]|uniref:secreted acidic protein 2-like n=1 Tax=Papaver somniferum TaxID=3469 RepID=UPI000E6F9369|nr:secreted acidic protein 2-like [Papaver somniferum]